MTETSNGAEDLAAVSSDQQRLWPIEDVRPCPRNARLHSEEQVRRIADCIQAFGFNAPILVAPDGEIVAGHGRLEAAKLLDHRRVPVVVLNHLDEDERRAYRIADNRLAELATWDEAMLHEEVADLIAEGLPALALGFSEDELQEILDELDPPDPIEDDGAAEDAASRGEELREKWQVERGMVWDVGFHRVMCGDATSSEDMARLLAPGDADMVITDPPYGVDYVGKTKDALTIQNDGASELRSLLRAAFHAALTSCRPGAVWYVTAPPGPQFLDFAATLSSLGVWRQTLTWVKNSLVLGRSDFHYRHEAILYGWKPGAAHQAPPDREQDSVWLFDRPQRNGDHPTMKPVALVEHAIRLSSNRHDIVLDPFAGSGTTLMAAASTARSARCMELDPRYCAVILERGHAAGMEVTRLDRG